MIAGRQVIDAFMLFDELDMLELRLHELDAVVDKFVIVESLETFGSVKTKPANLKQHWDVVKGFEDKVNYTILPQLQPAYTSVRSGWERERFQRAELMECVRDVAQTPDDIVIVADADEIPRATAVVAAEPLLQKGMHRLVLDFFYYNVNSYLGTLGWATTVGTVAQYEAMGGTHEARSKCLNANAIPDAGWHFDYFGGLARIRNKVEVFAHAQDDFVQAFLKRSDEEALKDIQAKQDIYRRPELNKFDHRSSTDPRLPAYFLEHPEKFKHFMEE